ncbi:DUF4879 domain-containing protein [Paenibacillus amylolyticus]|nr:DUF4879 domain-containing protein [Paenibacillus amylolyticus]WFR65407.1 DUF4879 domain-containing protein [Paenibacillus amylolyticus]
MRKMFSLALILVLVLSFNVAAYADGDVTQAKPLTKEEIINSKEFREAVKAAKAEFEAQKAKDSGGPVLFAPAPKVSHINVYGVVSPNGGQEIYGFNNNPLSTTNDHGGAWIQCITFQIGYDSSHYGKLAGNTMTNNWSEAIDLDGDRVVDAFAHSWVYESPNTTGGQFVGTVYSINIPTQWTAWINVR